mmetsp:Transcript_41393/g.67155  ORF Transcript_41393/g.67155 Transcript_41393/m.67155 type:complete len:249 (-) Transcript_41393:674-1420(-)
MPKHNSGTIDPLAISMPKHNSGIANPAGLGLAGFALTTFVLSTFNTGLISSKVEGVVVPLAFFYGGLCQLLAGMWEFKTGNTFGATAFSSYGGFWLSFAGLKYKIFQTAEWQGASAHDARQAIALFLLAWLIFTTYMCVAAWRTDMVIFSVFFTLVLTFIFLVAGEWSGNSRVTNVGGWLGLICAGFAWYGSFASVMNDTWKEKPVPTVPYTQLFPPESHMPESSPKERMDSIQVDGVRVPIPISNSH